MKNLYRCLFISILFLSGNSVLSAQITADSIPPGMFAVNPNVALSISPCMTTDSMAFDINCDGNMDMALKLHKGATMIDGANIAYLYVLNDSFEIVKDTGGMVSGYPRPHYYNTGDPLVPTANSMWGTDSLYQFGDYGCMSCVGPWSQSNVYVAFRKMAQVSWMKVSFSLNDGGSCVALITASIDLILEPCLPNDVPALTGETDLQVSPNPFSTTTILLIGRPLQNGTLIVYNSFGQVVRHTENLQGGSVTFYRDGLAEGVYFMALSDEKGMISVRKIVIAD